MFVRPDERETERILGLLNGTCALVDGFRSS
jgi:hypothetical protein